MELGDRIVVSERRHPFFKFTGTIVGKRGVRVPGDPMLLILIHERQRSFLIPESMVSVQEEVIPPLDS
ncbi:MAG TPA: hypothetical protein VN426_07815 [Syntrophomonadaceae bacterium]|nr:hypothetical protein [Syntrophomonadaceae bacterium]